MLQGPPLNATMLCPYDSRGFTITWSSDASAVSDIFSVDVVDVTAMVGIYLIKLGECVRPFQKLPQK